MSMRVLREREEGEGYPGEYLFDDPQIYFWFNLFSPESIENFELFWSISSSF